MTIDSSRYVQLNRINWANGLCVQCAICSGQCVALSLLFAFGFRSVQLIHCSATTRQQRQFAHWNSILCFRRTNEQQSEFTGFGADLLPFFRFVVVVSLIDFHLRWVLSVFEYLMIFRLRHFCSVMCLFVYDYWIERSVDRAEEKKKAMQKIRKIVRSAHSMAKVHIGYYYYLNGNCSFIHSIQ